MKMAYFRLQTPKPICKLFRLLLLKAFCKTYNCTLMLLLNIVSLARLRGITRPHKSMVQAGISSKIATEYIKGNKTTIVMQHIEVLCKIFNCTPNELFSWQPETKEQDIPTHPLQAIRPAPLPDTLYALQQLTVSEVKKLLVPGS